MNTRTGVFIGFMDNGRAQRNKHNMLVLVFM